MLHRRVPPTSLLVVISAGCGLWTIRAEDALQSRAMEELDCATTTVTMTPQGSYLASGCGKTRRYVCERDIATAVGKGGAIAALGCRRADAAPPAPSADASAP